MKIPSFYIITTFVIIIFGIIGCSSSRVYFDEAIHYLKTKPLALSENQNRNTLYFVVEEQCVHYTLKFRVREGNILQIIPTGKSSGGIYPIVYKIILEEPITYVYWIDPDDKPNLIEVSTINDNAIDYFRKNYGTVIFTRDYFPVL